MDRLKDSLTLFKNTLLPQLQKYNVNHVFANLSASDMYLKPCALSSLKPKGSMNFKGELSGRNESFKFITRAGIKYLHQIIIRTSSLPEEPARRREWRWR